MIAFDFFGYEGFKERFGIIEHGNGIKSRKNKILLSYIKNPRLIREARETGDYSLLNIRNMTELKKIMFGRITESAAATPGLTYRVRLLGYLFFSSKYETDGNNGLCEDGDFKECRYVNHGNNSGIFKMKAGKFIRNLILETEFGQTLPEQVLVYLQECFTQDWQTYTMGTLPKNHLYVNKEFGRIYNSRQCDGDFHSCMVNRGLHSFYSNAVDASAAYLQNEDGLIIARCVIYNRCKDEDGKVWRLAERQYSTEQNDVLKRALVDALIRGNYIDGYKQVGFDCHNSRGFVDCEGNSLEHKKFSIDCDLETYDRLSYQDSFKWYDIRERVAYNYETSDYDYCLDLTEGSIDGDDDDDDDEYESWDDFHDYGCDETREAYYHGRLYYVDVDNLDDFRYVGSEDAYHHKTDCVLCDVCGEWILKEKAVYSETLDRYFCSEEERDGAEKNATEAA